MVYHSVFILIGAFAFFGNAFFGFGEGPIILDNVSCTGNELSLFDCQHLMVHNCVHAEDVGIECVPQCNNGDVRLVNGTTPSEGRVEVCLNNGWGSVCDPSWTNADAMVVCNQLNLQSTSKEIRVGL